MAREYTSKPVGDGTFKVDGVVFTPASLTLLDFGDLAQYANLDVETVEGLAKLNEFFKTILGDDYQRFREHCAAHRTDAETLLAIISDTLLEATGFPTQQSSPSGDGSKNIVPMLRVISSDGELRMVPLSPEQVQELQAEVDSQDAQERMAG